MSIYKLLHPYSQWQRRLHVAAQKLLTPTLRALEVGDVKLPPLPAAGLGQRLVQYFNHPYHEEIERPHLLQGDAAIFSRSWTRLKGKGHG